MGEAELIKNRGELVIRSVFYFYGDASSENLAKQIADDIQSHWNEPRGSVRIKNDLFRISFEITGFHTPDLSPETVWYNDDPKNNYFRIEEFAAGNISFVDGIGCNTGYFKLDNLLQTSTTAAHEYGHTIGLKHPDIIDIRGTKVPGIMYPRGTIVDAHMQYDPTAAPGAYGGFLDPKFRKVSQSDIDLINLHKLSFDANGFAMVGGFSSLYHANHSTAGFQ